MDEKKTTISSIRLGYKRICEDSSAFLTQYLSRDDTTRYLPLGRPYGKKEVEEFIAQRVAHWKQYSFGLYLMFSRVDDCCIGYCGIEYIKNLQIVDLRYGVIVKHWGKGFATEAANACLKFGFVHLDLPVIYGAAVPDNLPSIAVMRKIGMRPTDDVDFYGDNLQYYSIRHRDFLSS